MGEVVVSNITKLFGDLSVLCDISLTVKNGEFMTIVGPSGCGKSTLLRIIAGLESQTGGNVCITGASVDSLRPRDRNVAMVFQSYALYPYMTGVQNIALPLVMSKLSYLQRFPLIGRLMPGTRALRAKIDAHVQEIAAVIGIKELLTRRPGQMSGGQQQRVALGRAMVREPEVFLMDEPLSNLDAKLRVQMRTEITDLHRRLGATFIYVTHDQAEAMTMSDRVAVMKDGKILQIGTPVEVYTDPEDMSVAGFIGSPQINLLPGIWRGKGVELGEHYIPYAISKPCAEGASVTVGLRPESLILNPKAGLSVLKGCIQHIEYLGSDVYVQFIWPGSVQLVTGRTTPGKLSGMAPGDPLSFGFNPVDTLLFDDSGKRLRPKTVQTTASMGVPN